jgi:hypothetical protein
MPDIGGALDYALLDALADSSTRHVKSADELVRLWQSRGMKGELLKRAKKVLAARAARKLTPRML